MARALLTMSMLRLKALGYCVVSLCTSSEAGAVAIQLINLPMMMLSGSMFSTEMLPAYFKPLVAILPLTYLSDGLRQIMIGASPMFPLWVDVAVLGGWLAVFLILSVRFWRWE